MSFIMPYKHGLDLDFLFYSEGLGYFMPMFKVMDQSGVTRSKIVKQMDIFLIYPYFYNITSQWNSLILFLL